MCLLTTLMPSAYGLGFVLFQYRLVLFYSDYFSFINIIITYVMTNVLFIGPLFSSVWPLLCFVHAAFGTNSQLVDVNENKGDTKALFNTHLTCQSRSLSQTSGISKS